MTPSRCRRTKLTCWATALSAVLHTAAALAQEPADTTGSQPAGGEGVAYEVEITGELEPELEELLTQTSQLVALRDQPPASLTVLRRRAEDDLARLQEALRSEGFYAGRIEQRIDEGSDPVQVTLEIDTGPLYLLSDYTVSYEGRPPRPDPASDLSALGLEIGMAARAPVLVEAQQRIMRRLANSGYPLAEVLDRRAVVDHATTTMEVSLRIAAGARASFGPVAIEGLENVEEDYVRSLVPWQRGDLFNQAQIESARSSLLRNELFSSVVIEHATAVDDKGALPVTIRLTERGPRTIGAGVSYSTSEGPGGRVYWEHRNLFGSAQRLRLSLQASLIEQRIAADFREPHFLRLDQAMVANGALARRTTDAFDEESARASLGLQRSLGGGWNVSGAGAVELSRLTEADEDQPDEDRTRTFLLYSTPISATRSTADSLLNPTEGTRLTLAATPYVGTLEENVFFLVSEASGSAYLSLDAEDRVILAGRARIGSIVGADTATVPASKRFYSGGGGSVRGYEFQSIGPENAAGDPTGGRSVLEIGGEVRFRVTEDIGLVPFIEGGTVGDQSFVDFDEEFLWAAGLGLRYYTAVGPLRLDVAFPINGRDRDDVFQFYISLGQAF